jgi:glycerophosphoryl diester phosphodiesterase
LNSFVGDINKLINKDYVDHCGLNYSIVSSNKQYIRVLQQSGKGVYVWTTNEKTIIIDMINLNVDGVITDYPILTRELVFSDSIKSEYTQLLEKVFTRN